MLLVVCMAEYFTNFKLSVTLHYDFGVRSLDGQTCEVQCVAQALTECHKCAVVTARVRFSLS